MKMKTDESIDILMESTLNSILPQRSAGDDRSNAIVAAELACQRRGVQFTPIRKLVLQTLWDAAQPVGAYTVLKCVEKKLDRRVTPPTIYRALDFLVEQRLISRLESRHAYVPCADVSHHLAPAYLICENCGRSEEIHDSGVLRIFEHKASALGFRIRKSVMELQGLCAACGESNVASASAAAKTPLLVRSRESAS
jgi:Fur family zinc uptake transcriptional regulator